MDKSLADGARQLFADNLFETVRRCYCEANKDYLDKQIKIASEYMTEKQKEVLRQKGIIV
jgi:ABC-type transporter MlaC component